MGPRLMNSKQEYNRCYIPKIMVKRNEKEEIDPHIVRENETIKKMKDLVNIWKKRSNRKLDDLPEQSNTKRRKLEMNVEHFGNEEYSKDPYRSITCGELEVDAEGAKIPWN